MTRDHRYQRDTIAQFHPTSVPACVIEVVHEWRHRWCGQGWPAGYGFQLVLRTAFDVASLSRSCLKTLHGITGLAATMPVTAHRHRHHR